MDEKVDPQKAVQANPKKLKTQSIETSVPSLYTNHAQFSMSEWDMRIDLGEQHMVEIDPSDAESAIMSVVPKLRLIMTPSYARLFAKTLTDVLEKRAEAEKQLQAAKSKSSE